MLDDVTESHSAMSEDARSARDLLIQLQVGEGSRTVPNHRKPSQTVTNCHRLSPTVTDCPSLTVSL